MESKLLSSLQALAMRLYSRRRGIIIAFAVFCFLVSVLVSVPSFAMQPMPPQITITSVESLKDVKVTLKNNEKFPVKILVYSDGRSSIALKEQTVELKANETKVLTFPAEMVRGRHVLSIKTQVQADKLPVVEGPRLLEAVEVSARVNRLDFHQTFIAKRLELKGKSDIANIKLGGELIQKVGIVPYSFKTGGAVADAKVITQNVKSPLELASLPLRHLDMKNFNVMNKGLIRNKPIIDPKVLRPIDINLKMTPIIMNPSTVTPFNVIINPITPVNKLNEQMGSEGVSGTGGLTISGRMSLQIAAGTLKSAWGWVTEAWQNQGGTWKFLGWAYVGGDGNWSISLDAVVNPAQQVYVLYKTMNRFVQVEDPAGNVYAWGDYWTLSGSNTNIGHRFADLTVNGDLPGIDELYAGATNVWVKFYENGLNALRDNVIRVTYPNSLATGRCINSSGNAWSCSYWGDGHIYIIPIHADRGVVQHECAHSIDSFYRNGVMPAGAGGSHSMWNCYNNGLALTEGFANFIAYWTQLPKDTNNAVITAYNQNLETLAAGFCVGQTNEMRVAATLWDTYDYWNDGPNAATSFDSLLYTSAGTPVALYLSAQKSKMADYLQVMKNGQSAYWQGEFEKLYRLNTIIP